MIQSLKGANKKRRKERIMMDAKQRAVVLEKLINNKEPGHTLSCVDVWRSGRIRTAYVLNADGCNCSPTLYCDDPWYTQEDEAVAEYLLDLTKARSCQVDIKNILTGEYVKEHVLPRLVPADNIDALRESGIVYRQYLNVAVIYYLPVDFPEDAATIQVTEELIRMVGLSESEVDSFALKNLRSEVDFLSMSSMLQSLVGEGNFPPVTEDVVPMWIVTNKTRTFGAAVLLYGSKLFEKLQEIFSRKVAILPSSVHELIAVPYDRQEQLNDFLSMVREVNATQVADEDLLGDCVYYYDGQQVRALA